VAKRLNVHKRSNWIVQLRHGSAPVKSVLPASAPSDQARGESSIDLVVGAGYAADQLLAQPPVAPIRPVAMRTTWRAQRLRCGGCRVAPLPHAGRDGRLRGGGSWMAIPSTGPARCSVASHCPPPDLAFGLPRTPICAGWRRSGRLGDVRRGIG
jgi:hypothetical protein